MVGASFRTSKITLSLTWRLYYGGAVITSITVLVRNHSYVEHRASVRHNIIVNLPLERLHVTGCIIGHSTVKDTQHTRMCVVP